VKFESVIHWKKYLEPAIMNILIGHFEQFARKSNIRVHEQLPVLTCCLIEELTE